MTYSAALFETDSFDRPIANPDTLADAQRRKMDRMLDMLGVAEGTRLLEVGTGWGELAIRAGQRGARVLSISNSAQQVAAANRLVREADLTNRVDIRMCDYRELAADSMTYDAIVSVEMIEGVSYAYLPIYLTTLDRLLGENGRIGLQLIAMRHDRAMNTRRGYSWINKYIFPGGFIPSIAIIEKLLARHTSMQVFDLKTFGQHYASTLRLWRERFAANWPQIAALGFDETFRRTWEFYLSYCEAGFASGYLNVHQVLLGRRARADEVRPLSARRSSPQRKQPACSSANSRRSHRHDQIR